MRNALVLPLILTLAGGCSFIASFDELTAGGSGGASSSSASSSGSSGDGGASSTSASSGGGGGASSTSASSGGGGQGGGGGTATSSSSSSSSGSGGGTTNLLDTFTRTNLGTQWGLGETGGPLFSIANNELKGGNGSAPHAGTAHWMTPFGSAQEAFVTLKKHDFGGLKYEILLLLRAQSYGFGECPSLIIAFSRDLGTVTDPIKVITYHCGGTPTAGDGVFVRIGEVVANPQPKSGDRLRASVGADGKLRAYINNTQQGTWTVPPTWDYPPGGRIGLGAFNLYDSLKYVMFDDFGGGDLP